MKYGEEHASDRGGVVGRADGTPLKGHTADLGGVDDTALEQVASSSSAGIPLVLLGAGVVAVVESVNEPIGVTDDEDTFLASVGVTRYSVYSRNTIILF